MEKNKCERCGDSHDNNDTPTVGSYCDDCLFHEDIFPDEDDNEEE